ncbi:MAG: response regulator, partial [Proteobacteria bacterium]|nr:response regulator [Pseudomonadota bacterium]
GGVLSLSSSVGRGSTFTLSLPFSLGDPRMIAEGHADNTTASTPRSILIVDDNVVNLKVAQTQLEKLGHTVFRAESGPEALMILEGEKIDLMLMDVEMPGMDGIETTEIIRRGGPAGEWPRSLSQIPVVAMTAHALGEVRTRSLSAGMNSFLTKPVNFSRLRTTIAEVCHLTADAPTTAAEPIAAPTPPPPPPRTDAILDREGAQAYLGVDEDTFAVIFEAGSKELASRVERTGKALSGGDLTRVASLSHDIKSASKTIGAMALSRAAETLERMALEEASAEINDAHQSLMDELRRLEQVLGQIETTTKEP